MKTYISLSGFDTSQILSLIVKYGIEEHDSIILIRPINETDNRGDATIQAVRDLSNQINSKINVEVFRVDHQDFDGMVISLIELINSIQGEIIANISGGPREIFLAFSVSCISQSQKIHKITNYSDIDRVMNEITLPNMVRKLDDKLIKILNDVNENSLATLSEIANRLNISESTVSRQLNKLFVMKAVDMNQKGKIKLFFTTLTGKIFLKNL